MAEKKESLRVDPSAAPHMTVESRQALNRHPEARRRISLSALSDSLVGATSRRITAAKRCGREILRLAAQDDELFESY
jgi:hypothetical protein